MDLEAGLGQASQDSQGELALKVDFGGMRTIRTSFPEALSTLLLTRGEA